METYLNSANKGNLVLYGFQVYIYIDEMEHFFNGGYHVIEDIKGEQIKISSCVSPVFLKDHLSEGEYNNLLRLWNLNYKIFQV